MAGCDHEHHKCIGIVLPRIAPCYEMSFPSAAGAICVFYKDFGFHPSN